MPPTGFILPPVLIIIPIIVVCVSIFCSAEGVRSSLPHATPLLARVERIMRIWKPFSRCGAVALIDGHLYYKRFCGKCQRKPPCSTSDAGPGKMPAR
jgi:hypothetical protein